MSVHAPAPQLATARTAPATPATFYRKRPTALSYGPGADSTAILLMSWPIRPRMAWRRTCRT